MRTDATVLNLAIDETAPVLKAKGTAEHVSRGNVSPQAAAYVSRSTVSPAATSHVSSETVSLTEDAHVPRGTISLTELKATI